LPDAKGSTLSRTTPYLRATSSADLRLVPAISRKVVGCELNWSVSFEAIHKKRGESRWFLLSWPALTR
jgi:hypothetical protein